MNEALLIFGMFIVTFGVRYVLFAMAGRVHFPAWLSTGLGFVPPAVLTAIIVPAVLMPQGSLWISPANPWLLAALVAVIVALVRKDLLTTIVIGMLAFIIFRFGFEL
ncbi:AzlD domain-containing protein [Neptunomonas antarctica]|uniref:Branched-chain amino acid transport protein n=1 Tax=Neptunomonas antarctica TaxID=619304 RepID=A0A1N7N8E3_9GAMM|nr:AzlD domain-containing protein [Neptunomonas antarctica]SIS94451.1 Branched-chain amino acid transport protein [Neptunomonas antarctica]